MPTFSNSCHESLRYTVLRRRDLGFKSHPKDWRRPGSNFRPLIYKASSFSICSPWSLNSSYPPWIHQHVVTRNRYNTINTASKEGAEQSLGICRLIRSCCLHIINPEDRFSHNEAHIIYEPHCEKTCLRGFPPGPTQTGLGSHRRWLEA